MSPAKMHVCRPVRVSPTTRARAITRLSPSHFPFRVTAHFESRPFPSQPLVFQRRSMPHRIVKCHYTSSPGPARDRLRPSRESHDLHPSHFSELSSARPPPQPLPATAHSLSTGANAPGRLKYAHRADSETHAGPTRMHTPGRLGCTRRADSDAHTGPTRMCTCRADSDAYAGPTRMHTPGRLGCTRRADSDTHAGSTRTHTGPTRMHTPGRFGHTPDRIGHRTHARRAGIL